MDNRQLFGADKHVNQLYLSSGRISKMAAHSLNDTSSAENGIFDGNSAWVYDTVKVMELYPAVLRK